MELREIFGFKDYFVSDTGRVFSGKRGKFREMYQAATGGNPYPRVRLYDGKTRISKDVHRLVLEAFRGPCPPGMMARHLNDNPKDNSLGNLQWGTPKENAQDRRVNGKQIEGESSKLAKFSNDVAADIRQRWSDGETLASLASDFSVATTTIHRLCTGKTWRCVDTPDVDFGGRPQKLRLVTAFGETKKVSDWSKDPRCLPPLNTLRRWLSQGIDPEEAMRTEPENRGLGARRRKRFRQDN